MRRVVVTGCSRTGTQYTAELLSLAGLAACHELVYDHHLDPIVPDLKIIDQEWRLKQKQFVVSWLAAPFLSYLPNDVVVWHQLRHPLKSLRCWSGGSMFSNGNHSCQFVHKMFPECGEGSDLERSIRYCILWNTMVEHSYQDRNYLRFRVENLTPEYLQRLLKESGVQHIDEEQLAEAFSQIGTNKGSCQHKDENEITWDEVLECPDGVNLQIMADRYGYQ